MPVSLAARLRRWLVGYLASRRIECRAQAPGGARATAVSPPVPEFPGTAASAPRAQFATAVAPALEDAPPVTVEVNEPPVNSEHRMAEVATFPSPSPAVSNPQAPKLAETPKAQRVVITPDGLIAALQGKLQQAAEKAVQAAVAKQVGE